MMRMRTDDENENWWWEWELTMRIFYVCCYGLSQYNTVVYMINKTVLLYQPYGSQWEKISSKAASQ